MLSVAPPSAAVIIIGNEILSGQTEDANLNYLARRLNDLGILLKEARIVLDVEDEIVHAVNSCRHRYTYVFTTGGIGPTHDDITAAAVARAFHVPVICNLEAANRLMEESPAITPTTPFNARMKMAEMPHGSTLIYNSVTRTPSFFIENVFVLAGIPRIMQAMFEATVPYLQQGPRRHTCIISGRINEGLIAHDLNQIQQDHPHVEIGSYPRWLPTGGQEVHIVMKGYSREEVSTVQEKVMQMFYHHGSQPEIIAG
jgi:molybdenum cofactor synthesis domain-containing protein